MNNFKIVTLTAAFVILLSGVAFIPAEAAAAPSPEVQPQEVGGPSYGSDSLQGPEAVVYVVRRGDTLFRIARRHGVSLRAILAANPGIRNPNRIFPGQRIVVPVRAAQPQTYVVRRGDTLFRIARRHGVSLRAILAANPGIRNPNQIFPGQRLVIPTGFGAPDQPTYGGDRQAPQQPSPGRQPGAGQTQVVMQNTSYQPQRITVQPGATVTWVNRDNFAHTVTAGTPGNPTGLFDSGNIGAGGSFSFTFDNPGAYDYYCSIHPDQMRGTVVVQQGGQQMQQQQQQQQAPQPSAPTDGAGYGGGY